MPTLTYPGDATHMIGEVHGPTHTRDLVTVIDATYDADADKTIVTVKYGARCSLCQGLLRPDDPAENIGTHPTLDLRLQHPGGNCP